MKHKIFWFGKKQTRHNNIRHTEIFRRLSDLIDPKYILVPQVKMIMRGYSVFEDRLLYPFLLPFLLRYWARRYDAMFCTSPSLIPLFHGRVVVDLDDPKLTDGEMELLNRSNVQVVVTTTELLRQRLVGNGLKKPCAVVPSGIDVDAFHRSEVPGETTPLEATTVCFVAPYLYLNREVLKGSEDHKLRTIDFLLSAMELVWARHEDVNLLLAGNASSGVTRTAEHYQHIHLAGYVQHNEIARFYSQADIGLYPRLGDFHGRHSIKLIEYMAAGLPVVSTNVTEAFHIERSAAGIIADTEEQFAEAIIDLVESPRLRESMGRRGEAYAQQFDWQVLMRDYREILMAYS